MTARSFTSIIEGSIKALGIDDWISSKLIITKAREIISNFLKKDNSNSRLVYKNSASFTEIEGLPMTRISVTECDLGDVFNCNYAMRSTQRLPRIYTSKFGEIINQIASINFGTIYQNAFTPRQFKAIQQREFKNESLRYFFFLDGFLYIPIYKSSEVSPEQVRISALFVDRWEVEEFKKLVGTCEECNKEINCKRPLDFEFVCPDYLLDDVNSKLIQDLANVYLKVIPDEYPNLSVGKNNQRDLQNRKITNS